MDRRCRTCRFWTGRNDADTAPGVHRCMFDTNPATQEPNDPRDAEVFTSANGWCQSWQARQ